jgi:hypothetical protein
MPSVIGVRSLMSAPAASSRPISLIASLDCCGQRHIPDDRCVLFITRRDKTCDPVQSVIAFKVERGLLPVVSDRRLCVTGQKNPNGLDVLVQDRIADC